MRSGVRFHLTLLGIDETKAKEWSGRLNFDEIDVGNGMLTIDNQGYRLDYEETVEEAAALCVDNAEGRAEILDFDAWEITRFLMKDGEIVTSRTFNMDFVLEDAREER